MTRGIFQMLTDTVQVQADVGCDFETAQAIVKAAYEYEMAANAPADNMVIAVDFQAKRRIDHDELA